MTRVKACDFENTCLCVSEYPRMTVAVENDRLIADAVES